MRSSDQTLQLEMRLSGLWAVMATHEMAIAQGWAFALDPADVYLGGLRARIAKLRKRLGY
jgi:hypothetical protein